MTKYWYQKFRNALGLSSDCRDSDEFRFIVNNQSFFLIQNKSYGKDLNITEHNFSLNMTREFNSSKDDPHFSSEIGLKLNHDLFYQYILRVLEGRSNDEINPKLLNQGLIALNYEPLRDYSWSRNYLTNGIIFQKNSTIDAKGNKTMINVTFEKWYKNVKFIMKETPLNDRPWSIESNLSTLV